MAHRIQRARGRAVVSVCLLLVLVFSGCSPAGGTPMRDATQAPPATAEMAATPAATQTPATAETAATAVAGPSAAPVATATVAAGPAFARTAAWLDALGAEYPTDAQIAALVEAFAADTVEYLDQAVDPARPLDEQEEALRQMAATLPGGQQGAGGPQQGQAVPVDLDPEARAEVFVVPVLNPGPILYAQHAGGRWQAVPVPVPSLDTGGDVAAAPNLWPASAGSRDVTGDGQPEAIVTHSFAGASSMTENVQVLAWNGTGFEVLFRASLVNWAGASTWSLEPGAAGSQDIVLTYPFFYATGFEHKMIAHPQGAQRWRWDAGAGRYVLAEATHDPESVLAPGSGAAEWDLLGVLVNEAEMRYQAADLDGALDLYVQVIDRAANGTARRPEGAANWPLYARFRAAQVRALEGSGEAAEEELRNLLAGPELSAESNLRPLVEAFAAAYDPHRPDAAVRAAAALHALGFYQQFYEMDDAAADLTFPMNAETILWPGTPLALYLDAHAEAAADAGTLRQALAGLGFPVVEVQAADLNGDGSAEVLVTTDETGQPNGPRATWLLARSGAGWRSYRIPGSGVPVSYEGTPDGRAVIRTDEGTYAWTGDGLAAADPATGLPLPPAWPTVGGG